VSVVRGQQEEKVEEDQGMTPFTWVCVGVGLIVVPSLLIMLGCMLERKFGVPEKATKIDHTKDVLKVLSPVNKRTSPSLDATRTKLKLRQSELELIRPSCSVVNVTNYNDCGGD
jgi:hypothetical protein